MNQQIIKTSDFNFIVEATKNVDQNTLIVFDVDEVLFQPKDQVLRAKFQQFIDKFEKIVHNMSHPENQVDYHSLILLKRQISPVNDGFINLIANLQNDNIKVVALTHCLSGEFGNIKSVADWRLGELQNIGYNFVHSWPNLDEQILETNSAENVESLPLFKQGVLFTNGTPKGLVLEAFLRYSGYVPNKIIFVDDLAVNIASVSEAAVRLNVEYIGIEYVAADELETAPLNEKRAEVQLRKLISEREWLNDGQIDKLANNL